MNLYHYFEKSALRTHRLGEFEAIFQQPQLNLNEVYETWRFNIYGPLKSLHRTWSLLVGPLKAAMMPRPKLLVLRRCSESMS